MPTSSSLPGIWSPSPNIVQGATFSASATVMQNDMPFDLTDYTADMKIRDAITNALILELSTNNGRISFGTPTEGVITFTIANTITDSMPTGAFPFDVILTNTNDSTSLPLLAGSMIINFSPTGEA